MAKIDTLEIGVKITNCKDCDRVEVVRCKDCYFYNDNKGICTNTAVVKSFYGCKVNPEDFCSNGERRSEDD